MQYNMKVIIFFINSFWLLHKLIRKKNYKQSQKTENKNVAKGLSTVICILLFAGYYWVRFEKETI